MDRLLGGSVLWRLWLSFGCRLTALALEDGVRFSWLN